MKRLLIVANWKSHKTSSEAHAWIIRFLSHDVISHLQSVKDDVKKEIVLCPPFTLLSELSILLSQFDLPITLGAQNVSPFDDGAYTGEESARQIAEYARYVIIGHSERRNEFHEDEKLLVQKVKAATSQMLTPIYCIQGEKTSIPDGVNIVAYEPVDAIGSGRPATPEIANEVAKSVKEKIHTARVLYGGSVTPENVQDYTSQTYLNGVLVGTDSLDPLLFSQIVRNA